MLQEIKGERDNFQLNWTENASEQRLPWISASRAREDRGSFPMENGQLNNYVNSVQEGMEQKVPECRKWVWLDGKEFGESLCWEGAWVQKVCLVRW